MNRFAVFAYGLCCLIAFNMAVSSILPGGRDGGMTASEYRPFVAVEGLWAGRGAAGEQMGVPIVWFRLRNNGPRTVVEVRVKVSFHDEQGQVVHEGLFHPVHDGAYGPPTDLLRSRGVWQMSNIRYFVAEGVPHTWTVGRVSAAIEHVRFAN